MGTYNDARSITARGELWCQCVVCRCRLSEYSIFVYARKNFTIQISTGHNSIITAPSIAKFTSESDIGDQAMSHCPWLNMVISLYSPRFNELLNTRLSYASTMSLAFKSCLERLRQVFKLHGGKGVTLWQIQHVNIRIRKTIYSI